MQIGSLARSLLHDLMGILLNRTRRCTVGVSVSAIFASVQASMFFADRVKTFLGEMK